MIVGFNHDNVVDPYSYGKSKAGITLTLGYSRAAVEDAPPHDWETNKNNLLLYTRFEQFDACIDGNTIASPYFNNSDTNKLNWEECQFREALQHLFDGSEVYPYLVEVEKRTATGSYNSNLNYYPSIFTNDKVSLFSEYEINGILANACAIEGEQYEFFKRGNSRFFWDAAFANKHKHQIPCWSRSPLKIEASKANDVLSYKGACCTMMTDTCEVKNYAGETVYGNYILKDSKTLINKLKSLTALTSVYGDYKIKKESDKYNIYDSNNTQLASNINLIDYGIEFLPEDF